MTLTSPTPMASDQSAERAAQALLRGISPVMLAAPGLHNDDIERAWQGLQRMVQTSTPEELARWTFKVARPGLADETDDGIIRKDTPDQKYYLHYRPDLPDLLAGNGVTLTDWQEDWLASCDTIRVACFGAALSCARELDWQLLGYDIAARMKLLEAMAVLRVLWYDVSYGVLAVPHTDRNAISTHIAESHPGLCAVKDGLLVPVPAPEEGHVQLFSGRQLAKVTGDKIPALEHTVENLTGTREQRWSLVGFHYV